MKKDHVDKVMQQWRDTNSELDYYPMACFARLARAAKLMGHGVYSTIKEFGLQPSEFDILATIRRNQSAVTPTQLYVSTMLTSGALTSRLNKLEEKQLIVRTLSAEDKRSFKISLTQKGTQLIDDALIAHLDNEKKLVEPLNHDEAEQLSELLKKWLIVHESSDHQDDD